MGDVLNLKRFRKRAERDRQDQQADANRARFGRTRAERTLQTETANRADRVLEQHRLDAEPKS